MFDQQLIDILACPETQQSLKLADKALVDQVNALIQKGTLKNRDQKKCDQVVDALLIRKDERYGYPVINNIPVLIVEEGIDLKNISLS